MTNNDVALLKSLLTMRDGLSDDLAERNKEARQIANEIHSLDAKIDDSVKALYSLHFDTDPGVLILGDVAIVGLWVEDSSYPSDFVVRLLPVWKLPDPSPNEE